MGVLLSLFTSRATWFVVAAAIIAGIIGFQHVRINHLKGEVVERDEQIQLAKAEMQQAKAMLTKWSEAYAGLALTVDEQNKQIDALEIEVRRRIENARAALRAAAKGREEAEALAQTIIKMELSTNECKALQQLVDTARAGGLH